MAIRDIFVSSIYYSSSMVINMGLGALRSGLAAKLLGPSMFGMWNIFGLIQQYASLSSLGFFHGVNREYPYHLGKRDNKYAEQIINTAFSITTVLSFVCGIILLATSFFTPAISGSADLAFSVRLLAGIIILSQLYEFFIIYLRNIKDFKALSARRNVYSIFFTLFALPFMYFFSYRGLIVALLLSFLPVIFLFKDFIKSLKFVLDRKTIHLLFWSGLPFFAIQLLGLLFGTMDRFIILKYFSMKMFGYYSFAVVVISFVIKISESLAYVIRPFVLSKAGECENEATTMKRDLIMILNLMAYIFPIFIVTVFIFMKPIIAHMFSEYIPSVDIIRIMCWGVLPLCFSMLIEPYIVATNKQKYVFIISLSKILVTGLLFVLLIFIEKVGITNIAAIISISHYVGCLAMLIYAFLLYKASMTDSIVIAIKLFAPFLVVMSLLTFVSSHEYYFNIITIYDSLAIQFIIALVIFSSMSITTIKSLVRRVRWRG